MNGGRFTTNYVKGIIEIAISIEQRKTLQGDAT
jgi:hypothetical protein